MAGATALSRPGAETQRHAPVCARGEAPGRRSRAQLRGGHRRRLLRAGSGSPRPPLPRAAPRLAPTPSPAMIDPRPAPSRPPASRWRLGGRGPLPAAPGVGAGASRAAFPGRAVVVARAPRSSGEPRSHSLPPAPPDWPTLHSTRPFRPLRLCVYCVVAPGTQIGDASARRGIQRDCALLSPEL